MRTTPIALDQVFRALSDPTRRAVIERLGIGPTTTSELARPFDMALPSFTEHLGMLEEASLVASIKNGRIRTYRLTPEALAPAGAWIANQRGHWATRLDQLDSHLNTTKEPR